MDKDKKEALVKKVNGLLSQLNQSVENTTVKAEIQKAYNQINQPEKLSMQVKQMPDAINELDRSFQQIALAKQYHFDKAQSKIISELLSSTRGSLVDGPIGVINGVVWHG